MALADLPPLLSSDGHLEVLPERWTPRMPAGYRAKAPRTVRLPDGGDALVVDGQEPRPVNFIDLRGGRTNETWQPFGVRVEDTAGVGPPEQRLREQDMDGLAAEVLFPNMVMGPRLWRLIAADDAYRAAVRAYNDWLAEEYCAVAPDRLIGLGVIPWTCLDDAIAELTHCARLGLKGVMLGVFPAGKAYPTPDDDRFWSAALDLGMPLTVHVGFDRQGPRASQPTFEYPGADPAVLERVGPRKIVDWVALNFMGMPSALSLAQTILSGVFDRLPDLRIFFAETRLGWVPFWMEEADYWYERHRHWAARLLHFKPLRERPSDYVRRHIAFSVQHVERVAIELRHHLGPEHVMFATDFPHIECDWPNTRPFAERLFAGVPAAEAYRIGAGNMLKFFRLEDTPMGRAVRARAGAAA
jgi:predicted TIM-barrel fold metal-dependent hydrolase